MSATCFSFRAPVRSNWHHFERACVQRTHATHSTTYKSSSNCTSHIVSAAAIFNFHSPCCRCPFPTRLQTRRNHTVSDQSTHTGKNICHCLHWLSGLQNSGQPIAHCDNYNLELGIGTSLPTCLAPTRTGYHTCSVVPWDRCSRATPAALHCSVYDFLLRDEASLLICIRCPPCFRFAC